MGHTWTPATDSLTLDLDGSESGEISVTRTLTGFTASTLYTFYLPVTQEAAGYGAFIRSGSTQDTATGTSLETLSIQVTSDGSGHIPITIGVTDADAGTSGGSGLDTLGYANQAAAEAAGWVYAPVTGVGITTGFAQAVNGHSPSIRFVVTGGGGSLSAQVYKDFTLPAGSGLTYSVGMLKGSGAPWFSNASVQTYTGGVLRDSSYSSTTGYGALTVGGDGVVRIILSKGQGGPYVHASEDYYFADLQMSGSFGGAGTVEWGALGYCEGSGLTVTPGDPGTGDGEPVPLPPPGGYPPPPVGGDRPFTAYGIPTGGFGYFNGTIKKLGPSFGVNQINETTTNDAKNFFVFGETSDWLTGGVFDYNKWKAIVDSVANHATLGPLLDAAIASGNAFGHHVIDEPYHPTRYGGPISIATVERMCLYSKSIWPTWPTVLRVAPTFSWITRLILGCDWLWAEYLTKRGDCTAWRDDNIARAEELGYNGCIMGLHYAQFTGVGGRDITPDEIIHYWRILAGGTLAQRQMVPAFGGWQWNSRWYSAPGAVEAVHQSRDFAASQDP